MAAPHDQPLARTGVEIAAADSDATLIALWLHGRSAHTQRAYRRDIARFRESVKKPLTEVTLGDVQDFARDLEDRALAPASRARTLAALKSLLSFGHRIGMLAVDVGRPLRLPPRKDTLAERILTEDEVQRMLSAETEPRNRALLLALYFGGLRVSEACGLRWRDLRTRQEGGQITVYGKGAKTRAVLLPAGPFNALLGLRRSRDGPTDPVFRSRNQKALSTVRAWQIVRAAAERVGITVGVSPHFLRHSHASHALDNGAPIHLVQATLGHASVATTGRYLHVRPGASSGQYLGKGNTHG